MNNNAESNNIPIFNIGDEIVLVRPPPLNRESAPDRRCKQVYIVTEKKYERDHYVGFKPKEPIIDNPISGKKRLFSWRFELVKKQREWDE